MMTAFRTFLVAFILGLPPRAVADPQSQRSIAMTEIRMASQAEVLAAGCGLRLNQALHDKLRNEASIILDADGLAAVEDFARTYTLNLLHRHHQAICARALDQLGPQGEQIEGLLLQP